MERAPSLPEGERHPTLDTFERVLNHGVIVDVERRCNVERRRGSRVDAEAVTALALVELESEESTHPIFAGESWKAWRED